MFYSGISHLLLGFGTELNGERGGITQVIHFAGVDGTDTAWFCNAVDYSEYSMFLEPVFGQQTVLLCSRVYS